VYALYLLIFHTATSEFSGLPAIMITFPWSLLSLHSIWWTSYLSWYSQLAGSPILYGFFAMLGLLPFALLNASILYFIGCLFDRNKPTDV
jgi:hypothetical protein